MTTKPTPSSENVDRARRWCMSKCAAMDAVDDGHRIDISSVDDTEMSPCDCLDTLAAEFAASDAIAYERGRVAGLAGAVVACETMQRENALIGRLPEANGAEGCKLRIQRTLLPPTPPDAGKPTCTRDPFVLARMCGDPECPVHGKPDAGKTSEE
jgi:hypothetical protein